MEYHEIAQSASIKLLYFSQNDYTKTSSYEKHNVYTHTYN